MIAAFLAILGLAVLTPESAQQKRLEQELIDEVEGLERFVDVSVRLNVVVASAKGREIIPGAPRLEIVKSRVYGGIVDTKASRPHLCGPPDKPRDWYCSIEQEPIILHADAAPLGSLVHGSEGAGKTMSLAQWHWFRWMEHLGEHRWGGQFAPTLKRLGLIKKEMLSLYRPEWGRYVMRRDFEGFVMCDGSSIMFQSNHKQSAAGGSSGQGSNLSWNGRDEMQDMVSGHADMTSRGRSARRGRYKQLATATAKDDSSWRELQDKLTASGKWGKYSLSIFRSPFVTQSFLDEVKPTISAREFLRRYGDPITGNVVDLPPELAVYYGWIRKRNLTALPRIAVDVTAAVLSGYRSYKRPAARMLLVGSHDPGSIYNTTTFQKLMMFGDRPTWIVVGEHQTSQTTARGHAKSLKQYVQNNFGLELNPLPSNPDPSGKVVIFCDPHGKGEAQTDYQSVYMAFQEEGLDVFNPSPMTARIKRSARIEMVNRLLGGSADQPDVPRLVIAQDEHGAPVAPKLVEAFESLKKRPGDDNPEGGHRKDEADKTHAPAALAYGLWPFEQEAFTATTVQVAIAEAKRVR